jgi:hypothetical protein
MRINQRSDPTFPFALLVRMEKRRRKAPANVPYTGQGFSRT